MRRVLTFVFALLLLAGMPTFIPAQSPVQQQQTQTKEQTVYATKTGNKYHTATCRYLAKSKIAMSLKEAKAKGLTACGVCRPPK